MVLLPDFNTVFMIPFEKGLATVSFLGVVRLTMDSAEIKSHSNFTGKRIDNLYHYDPGWHLSHDRFSGYWAQDLIRQTNCAHILGKKVRSLMFSRDLSSLEHFVMKYGLINLFKSVTPDMVLGSLLPVQSENHDLSIRPSKPGWRLNPIWKNWSHD